MPLIETPSPPAIALDLTERHLETVRAFYDEAPTELKWGARSYRRILAHYFNLLIPPSSRVLEIGCGNGELLAQIHAREKCGVDLSGTQIAAARRRLPAAHFSVGSGEGLSATEPYDAILISDTLNLAGDVQRLLERALDAAQTNTRLVVNFQNSLWRPLLALAKFFGLKSPQPQNSWLSSADVINLLQLSGWEVITRQGRMLMPVPCFGLEIILNRWLGPLFPWLGITVMIVARPKPLLNLSDRKPSVSVVIPARNESGNIAAAVARTPDMGGGTELIFVEGHSRDDTWEAIQRVAAENPHRVIKILRQTGKGKGDAVRAGFQAATGDILMILDADLTMPPEELPKFYDVISRGTAEFANGVRLVYPMEDRAMRFLNLCANKSFGIIFTWLLGQPVKDTLCGTKVLSREHYKTIVANRSYFGDFDPFGDFDLLFGAAKQNLKIADIPIRYRERTYGTTNIHRWSHGWLLLRMVAFAARKLKFV